MERTECMLNSTRIIALSKQEAATQRSFLLLSQRPSNPTTKIVIKISWMNLCFTPFSSVYCWGSPCITFSSRSVFGSLSFFALALTSFSFFSLTVFFFSSHFHFLYRCWPNQQMFQCNWLLDSPKQNAMTRLFSVETHIIWHTLTLGNRW